MNDNPAQPPPVPVETSLAARLTNVFVAPGEVFAEVKASPVRHANWIVPAVIFILVSWGMGALLMSQDAIKQQMAEIQDQAFQKQFQKQIDSGKMTQVQVDQFKAGAAKYEGIAQIFAVVIVPLLSAVKIPFLGGFVIWFGGTIIFKRPFPYMKGVEIAGMVLVVVALGALVKGLLAAALGNIFASPGPALLLKPFDATNPWHNLLATMDVFALWALLLKATALAKLSDLSFAKAVAWVGGVAAVVTGGLFAFSWAMQQLMATISNQGR